jgi:hypothetical protein
MKLYIAQDESTLASGRLEESTEELFDVLSCYFPVAFTPPPNDPHGITRDQIASELESALTVYPAFAPFIMELVSEKLASTLLHAKMDALHLLQTAAAAASSQGGGDQTTNQPMREHIPAIWTALKKEIMAPTTEGLVEPEMVKVEEVAVAAADCLTACITAFSEDDQRHGGDEMNSNSLPFLVLNDTGVEDMFTCIASPGTDRASLRRSVARVKSMSLALGTLGSAGGHPAAQMSIKIIPRLLDAIDTGSTTSITCIQSQDLAWAALASLLRAMNTNHNTTKQNDVALMDAAFLERLLKAAMSSDETAKQPMDTTEASVFITENQNPTTPPPTTIALMQLWLWNLTETSLNRIRWLKLTTLQAVLSCSSLACVISEKQGQEILEFLVDAATITGGGGGGGTSGSSEPRGQPAAAAALCAAARLLDSEIVIKYALTPLLDASTHTTTITANTSSRRAAIAALKALCVSNPSALLQPTLVGLETALRPAMQHVENLSLANDILTTVSEIILEIADTADRAMHAACFATFAEHLLDEVLLLGQEKNDLLNGENQDILTENVAQAVFLGVRDASVEAQNKICIAAVEAVSLSSTSSNLASAAGCAAFIALRKEVASETIQAHATILPLLAAKAPTAPAASVALASFLNKIEASQLNSTKVTSVLSSLTDPKTLQNASSYKAVAEVTRALAMRGASAPADTLIKQVAANLKTPGSCLIEASSSFFKHILYTEDDNDATAHASPALTRSAHAVVKHLWKQRTFNVAAAALDSASRDMQVQHEESSMRALTCAMGSLLGAAPPAVLRADSTRTLPWLTRCLSELSKQQEEEPEQESASNTTVDSNNTIKLLLQSLLKSTVDFLSSESGRKQAEGSLPTLIPALIRLGQYKPAMAVREMSLRCLTMLMMLPYAVLHPYKKEVLRVATAAADDAKRSVRGAAALCREAWGGGSTSIV